MAIAYSQQFDDAYISPLVQQAGRKTYARKTCLPFNYTNPATGDLDAIGDQIYLVKVPACCEIVMFESLFAFDAWAGGTTIDLGWLAYTGPDGVAVVADDNGLLDGLVVSAEGFWHAGVLHTSTDTTVRKAAIANIVSIRANGPVTLTATFRDTAPDASSTFDGYFTVLVD